MHVDGTLQSPGTGLLKKSFLTAKYAKKALSMQSQIIIIQLFAIFAL
jgi:hypothetical protein